MATLDNSDFTEIAQIIRSNPDLKPTFKSWGISKPVWKATMQAAEDWFVNGALSTPTESFKAALEAEAGSMTNGQMKAVGRAWMSWRFSRDV